MPVNLTQIEMLRKLLRHGATERVVRITSKFRPAELAEVFGSLSPAEQRQLVEVLYEHGQLADILVEIPQGILEQMIERIPDERLSALLEDMALDDAVFILTLLEESRVEPVMQAIEPAHRERIEHLRTYPAKTAGSLMTSDMLTVLESLTVAEAIDEIRRHGEDSEFVFYVYVINEQGVFVGVVPIRRLIAAKPARPIREIMVVRPIAVQATDHQEDVAAVTARYNLLAVPVVDEAFKLLGVITVDDIIDVMQDEATEDMYLMQGLSDEDRVYTPVLKSVRKRFPWTLINLATAFTAASVIGLFEGSISQAVVLATFMPVVAGVGGNGGTQTLTVITRGIALGELHFADSKATILRQVSIGLINGLGAGLVTGLVGLLWKGNPYLGLVLLGAMVINMTIAGLVGAAVPIVLKTLRLDPALGGGIIVTACTDSLGFMAFLGLATLALERLI